MSEENVKYFNTEISYTDLCCNGECHGKVPTCQKVAEDGHALKFDGNTGKGQACFQDYPSLSYFKSKESRKGESITEWIKITAAEFVLRVTGSHPGEEQERIKAIIDQIFPDFTPSLHIKFCKYISTIWRIVPEERALELIRGIHEMNRGVGVSDLDILADAKALCKFVSYGLVK